MQTPSGRLKTVLMHLQQVTGLPFEIGRDGAGYALRLHNRDVSLRLSPSGLSVWIDAYLNGWLDCVNDRRPRRR